MEARSASCGDELAHIGEEPVQFAEETEIGMVVVPPPETGSSFTALLELPANQAMELLHSAEPEEETTPAELPVGDVCWSNEPVIFPSNAALIDRASKFSVFAAGNLPENCAIPVKQEAVDSDSLHISSPTVSNPNYPTVPSDYDQKSTKRKEREEKLKGSTKKSKVIANEDGEKLPYVHVRARRGQATDSHSLAERARREKINARMTLLQELVPGCNKISGTAMVLDEIINHVQSLQRQVEFLSMRLAAVNPRIDINLDNLSAAENGSLMDSNFPRMVIPSIWPEGQFHGNRQQYQQLWHFDRLHQPVRSREEDNPDFTTPDNSLLSYDSPANLASLHSNQLKMEL